MYVDGTSQTSGIYPIPVGLDARDNHTVDHLNDEPVPTEGAESRDDASSDDAAENPASGEPEEPLGSTPRLLARRLERTADGRILAGVAIGLAAYFSIDVSLVRIAFVVLSLFGGVGIVLYASGWLLMPEHHRPSVSSAFLSSPRRHGTLMAVAAVAGGIALLSLVAHGPIWGYGGPFHRPKTGWVVVLAVAGFLILRWLSRPHGTHLSSLKRLFRRVAIGVTGIAGLLAVSTLVTVLVTGVSLRGGIGSKDFRPTSIAQLQTTYHAGIGNMTLDLRALPFPAHSVTVSASVAIGHLVVEVPNGIQVSLSARSGIGNVNYGNGGAGAFEQHANSSSSKQLLILEVQAGIGQVDLVRGASAPGSASALLAALPTPSSS